ncbi:MAG: gliding motility-associated C-terminal domain-containing protein [Ferruginibacter sp.]
MIKKLLTFFIMYGCFVQTGLAQTINITNITTTGRFNSCGNTPVVTATLVSGSGTSVVGNTLVCDDPCGTTSLRILLTNVQWSQSPGANWIHGLFFPQNPGFTVSGIGLPAGWASFPTCTGASCSAGETGGAGFYFDGTNSNSCCSGATVGDGIPNNNFGDITVDCGFSFGFQFDMTFCNSAIVSNSLSFQLRGTADGNTGCWSTADGLNNTLTFTLSTVACPDIYNVPFTSTLITDCSVTPPNYYAQLAGGCGNGSTVTWWDAPFGGNLLGTGPTFTYDPPGNACPAGTTIYASCCPTGSTQCANRFAVPITGTCPPGPTATHTKTDPLCYGINDGTISITPNTAGPYNVTLTGPGGPYNQTGLAPVTFTGLGPGTYSYTFTDAGGCSGSGGPVTLVTNPQIFTPAALVDPLCYGGSDGSVTFTPTGGVPPYEYSDNGGTAYQTVNTFSGLTAGPHTFRIKDNVGCTKDTTVILNEPTQLVAAITGTTPAGCSDDDGTISAAGSGATPGYTYTLAGPTVNTTGSSSGTFTGLAHGSYTITVTDSHGCTANATGVVGLIDNMFLTLGPDVTICAETSVTFDPQTNPQTNTFTWSGINGTATSTIANPNIKNAVATPRDTATYELHAQWGTCERRDTIVVNLLHKPVPDAGSDTAICNLSYAILRGSSTKQSGTVNYEWTPADNVEFPHQAVTRVFPPKSDTTYTYTLIVRDEYGCNFVVSDAVNIRVQPPVPAYAGNDTIAVLGIPHQLLASGGDTYLWTPSTPLNNAGIRNPLATLQADQKFVVKVTDFAGCIGYDTVFVKVYKGPTYYVPNAFTPNGDGLNDVFRPIPVGIVRTDWFRVFNRFGEAVFETTQWMKGWDGTFKGKKQPVGSYVWIIKGTDRDGKTVEMKGSVMLVQ